MGEETKVYRVLVGKPEVKRPLGRPRSRWEDAIRMDLSVEWIQLARDRSRGRAHKYGDEPSASGVGVSVVNIEINDELMSVI
jgi:hypothetical protein